MPFHNVHAFLSLQINRLSARHRYAGEERRLWHQIPLPCSGQNHRNGQQVLRDFISGGVKSFRSIIR